MLLYHIRINFEIWDITKASKIIWLEACHMILVKWKGGVEASNFFFHTSKELGFIC